MSTDTMGSIYTSDDDNIRPITKRKVMHEDRLREGEPTKKKARPLLKEKSGIESDNNNNNNNNNHSAKVVELKKKGRSKLVGKRKQSNGGERSTLGSNKSAIKGGEEYFTIQQLLSLTRQRKIEAQSKLSLVQLKQQAREKARSNANRTVRAQQTSKRKTTRNGKRHQPKSSLAKKTCTEESIEVEAEDEPVETIQMNTGTMYLYRGLKPRAEFVWK